MMRFCIGAFGVLSLVACVPTAPVTPQRMPSPHPVFEYPQYDTTVCDTIDVTKISKENRQLIEVAPKLVNLAVLYNSTPSRVLKMLYVAEKYGVSEKVFLYGFTNFTDALDTKEKEKDPVISTYSEDSFIAFEQWHSTIADMTEQDQINYRNKQIKGVTGISREMSLAWYKYMLSDWESDFDAIRDNMPSDDTIVKIATVNRCVQLYKVENSAQFNLFSDK